MRKMTMTFMALALVWAVALLTACDGDSTGPESVAGLYILQTYDGMSLPAVLAGAGNNKLEITAGSVRLNSDNTYSRSSTLRHTQAGTVTTKTDTQAATYTVSGSTIQFSPGTIDGRSRMLPPAPISGNTLTITIAGNPFVYTK